MGLSILGCSLALTFANLDKFSKFKGAGFEAILKQVKEKTSAAVEELKDLGLALTAPIVDTMTLSGDMFKYIHLKYKLANAEKIKETLVKLGASAEEIDGVCGILYRRVTADHYHHIAYALKEANPDSSNAFSDIQSWDFNDWDKAQVEKIITENKLLENKAVSECIADLDYWLENQALRTESKWQS